MRPVLKLQPCNKAIKSLSSLGIPFLRPPELFHGRLHNKVMVVIWSKENDMPSISNQFDNHPRLAICMMHPLPFSFLCTIQPFYLLSIFFAIAFVVIFSPNPPPPSSLSSDSSPGLPSFTFLPCPSLLQTNRILCCSRVKPDSREVLVRIENPILDAYEL